MSKILAIDPGQTTGLAVEIDGNIITYTETEVHDVWKYLVTQAWDQVICENFTTGGVISKYGLHTVRIIGGVQALCFLNDISLVMHMPQHRYIAQLEANERVKNVHERDALAHLLAWKKRNV